MTAMNILEIAAIVLFSLALGAGLLSLVSGALLFNLIRKKYAAYYKKIGYPIVFGVYYDDPASLMKREFNGLDFTLSLLAYGLSQDLPKDKIVRKLAVIKRYAFGCFLLAAPAFLIVTAHVHRT